MQRIILLLLIITFAVWLWSLRRASTLFTLRIRQGRIASSSGRIPARLLSDIADIAERGGVVRATIRGVVRDGQPVLLFDGEMSPGTQQQIRNVAGQFTAAEIRGGKKAS